MDNDSLLSVFLIIAIITVSVIDIVIIYMCITSFCCKADNADPIRDLRKPLIGSVHGSSINDNDGNDQNYYTSL